jgi:hypothetical protein
MTGTIQEPVKKEPLFQFEQFEHARCLVCDGAISREHVVRNLNPETGIQTVKVHCSFCNDNFKMTRRRHGEGWEVLSVERITDARERDNFQARLDHLHGDVQRQERHKRRLAEEATEPSRDYME